MKDFSAKYQGNDFREWYKANYGSDYDPAKGFARTEGMSDVDWAIGSNLYNSYLTGQNLENSYNSSKNDLQNNYNSQSGALESMYEQNIKRMEEMYNSELEKLQRGYGTAKDSLDVSKKNSQQMASITLDKLKKYLPTQIKAQGLGGLGVSESSMLQAYNNYNNTMGQIEGDYNTNKASLDASFNDSKSSLDTARSTGNSDAYMEYSKNKANLDNQYNSTLSELERAYQENKANLGISAGEQSQNIFDKYLTDYKNEQDALYNEILYAIQKGGYTNEQDIISFIDQFGENLGSDRMATLKQNAKGLAADNLRVQQDENFGKIFDYYANSSYSDADSLENYINQFKGKISDEDWNTAQQWISDVRNSPEEQARQEAIKEQQELDAFNSVTKKDVTFNNDGGWWIFGSTDMAEKGNNFSVRDGDGFKYRIQSGGEVADSNISNAARNIGNREVFGYAGKLYYKENGKIYLVEKRDNSYGDHYDKLYKRFFG